MTILLRNRMFAFGILFCGALAFSAAPVSAEVTLPHIFGDNMVLQSDRPIPVWGWAANGEEVTVALAGEKRSVKAGEDGRWKVILPSLHKEGPLELSVKGSSGSQRVFKNVLLGEVWVCAGQSNMEKPIGLHPGQKPCIDYEKEIAAADYPQVRLLEVPPTRGEQPAADADCKWLACSPQNIVIQRGGGHGYSACAYFFGRELHSELKVPIGLIAASASGTRCEPWTPAQTPGGEAPVWYNGMIAPLMPMAMRGVIWYQGESNMGDGSKYFPKMQSLVRGWRSAWGQGDFPFYFVQLPNFGCGGDALARLREAQTATLALPNTGMAVTIDIGSYPDCHCPNKQDVGRRLALWALAKDYGRKDLVYSGPLYKSMQVEGDKIRIRFEHVGGGLLTRDGAEELTCFEISGADDRFAPAQARIDGDSVLVSGSDVKQPTAVRFAWDEKAVPNLINKEGLPASTFRTNPPQDYAGGAVPTEPVTLRLTDFGAKPDSGEDASPAMQRVLAEAAKYAGPVTLEIPKGRYDLFPEKASHRVFFASNACDTDGQHIVAVDLRGMKRLTLDGQGSLLLMRGNMTLLAADGCEDLVIKNLTFDFLRPSMSEVKITEVGRDYWIGEVHRDSKYELVDGKRVRWIGENWKAEHSLVQIYEPANNTTWRLNCDPLHDGNSVEEVRPGVLRFRNEKLSGDLKAGRVLQCRMVRRDEVGMWLNHSKNVTLSDVTVRYMHGFGILGQFSENLNFERLTVTPDKASGRTCAAFADILHFSMCKGKIVVRDSVLTAAHDDAINVHGIHLQVVDRPAPNQILVKFAHGQTYGFQAFFPGDKITYAKRKTLENFGDTTVQQVEVRSPHEQLLTLADPLPDQVVLKEDCVENTTWTPSLEVTNCDVAAIPTRGFLITTRKPVLIENNRFFRIYNQSIEIANDAAGWFESGPIRDVTIRGNRFYRCSEAVIGVDNANHSGLRIENNEFLLNDHLALSAVRVRGVTFRGNKIKAGNPPADQRQLGITDYSTDVLFENNTIEKLQDAE